MVNFLEWRVTDVQSTSLHLPLPLPLPLPPPTYPTHLQLPPLSLKLFVAGGDRKGSPEGIAPPRPSPVARLCRLAISGDLSSFNDDPGVFRGCGLGVRLVVSYGRGPLGYSVITVSWGGAIWTQTGTCWMR